jgi:5-methyltetrahydrofolate--homocysteine methyltransferase
MVGMANSVKKNTVASAADHPLLKQIASDLIQGRSREIEAVVEQALAVELSPQLILHEGLLKGMDVVGQHFREGTMFLSQVLVSAKAMKKAMAIIEPLLFEGEVVYKGKVLLGTVKGDFHDIGKNLVATMLRINGFQVDDLGVDCPPETFLSTLKNGDYPVCGLSAMLTSTMVAMRSTVELIKRTYPELKVIVGGASVNAGFAEQICADAYARDASEAVGIVSDLVKN